MKKITGCILIIIFFTGISFISSLFAVGEDEIDTLHREALVWDCHNDLSYRVLYEGLEKWGAVPTFKKMVDLFTIFV